MLRLSSRPGSSCSVPERTIRQLGCFAVLRSKAAELKQPSLADLWEKAVYRLGWCQFQKGNFIKRPRNTFAYPAEVPAYRTTCCRCQIYAGRVHLKTSPRRVVRPGITLNELARRECSSKRSITVQRGLRTLQAGTGTAGQTLVAGVPGVKLPPRGGSSCSTWPLGGKPSTFRNLPAAVPEFDLHHCCAVPIGVGILEARAGRRGLLLLGKSRRGRKRGAGSAGTFPHG